MCTCLFVAVEAFHDGFEQATETFKRNQRAVAGLAEARRELAATSEALSKAGQEHKGLKVRQVQYSDTVGLFQAQNRRACNVLGTP